MKDDVSVQSFCLVIPVSGKPKIASCDYGTTQYDSGAATVERGGKQCGSTAFVLHFCSWRGWSTASPQTTKQARLSSRRRLLTPTRSSPLRFTSGNLSSRDCFVADIQSKFVTLSLSPPAAPSLPPASPSWAWSTRAVQSSWSSLSRRPFPARMSLCCS